MDYQVVLALLQQSQEDVFRLRKELSAHDPSILQDSLDRMQTTLDDMSKTLYRTQISLNASTLQNEKLSCEMTKYMEFYMEERKQREALETDNLRMKKLLTLYQSNGASAEEAKIIKSKHFNRSSEKNKQSSTDVDRREEEHDFDGTNPPLDGDSSVNPDSSKNVPGSQSRKQRMDYAKNTYTADEVVEHFSDENVLPVGYRIIETRLVREFDHIEKVVEHRYHILRCVDACGKIVDVYMPRDKQDLRMPGVETIKGCPATTSFLAKRTIYSEALRKAVSYAMTLWKQLTLYIDHGDWSIDNNTAERSMRALAVGRNNFVGFGSHEGASLGACAYTMVESCKLNAVSPYEYIKKVLTIIGEDKEDENDYSIYFRVF